MHRGYIRIKQLEHHFFRLKEFLKMFRLLIFVHGTFKISKQSKIVHVHCTLDKVDIDR